MKIRSNLVDIHDRRIYPAEIYCDNGRIVSIKEIADKLDGYILPGFIDAHVHIESSMVTPVEFSRGAVRHGTIAVVSDPHEICNVLGKEGALFMIENAGKTPLKILFGAPSCVPATFFESSGAVVSSKDIEELLQFSEVGYLSEMMNYPGVVMEDQLVIDKIEVAKKYGVPVDGHAPGLSGPDLIKYIEAGITTDHECFSYEEAIEKISLGMKILIREGSGAKNFNALVSLLGTYPDRVMFCTDDLHPDDLLKGHINLMVKRAIDEGYNLFDVIRASGYNAARHYGLDVGMLRENDPADFIMIESLESWNIIKTYIGGEAVFENGKVKIASINVAEPNKFNIDPIKPEDLSLLAKGKKLRVIQAEDGELITREVIAEAKIVNNRVISDIEKDVLKIEL
jgi:adenine deaminase